MTTNHQIEQLELPSADEAERAVIGAILLDHAIYAKDPVERLSAADFYNPLYRSLFGGILELYRDGKQIDPITVGDILRRDGSLDHFGGAAAITKLAFGIPHLNNLNDYIRLIRDASRRRALVRRAESIRAQAISGEIPVAELLESAESDIKRLAEDSHGEGFYGRILRPVSLNDLIRDHPTLRPSIIDGLLRAGEVANFVAKSKVGKSWLAYQVALSVVCGHLLFGQFRCHAGKVLIIDNELHPETLASRIPSVANALGIQQSDYGDQIEAIHLRGRLKNINEMKPTIAALDSGNYQLIILDALYRMLPEDVAENSNDGMARVYNKLDEYAAMTGAAFLVIHHATKGGQSDKDVTDVGSGGGSQSRAADSHIILRPHQEEKCAVLDASVRSWEPIAPYALRWEFPLWRRADDLDVENLKGRKTRHEDQKQEQDAKGMDDIFQALLQSPDTVKGLTTRVGMGPARVERLAGGLVRDGRITYEEIKKRGQECRLFRTIPTRTTDWQHE